MTDQKLTKLHEALSETDQFPSDEIMGLWGSDDGETSVPGERVRPASALDAPVVGGSLTVLTGPGSGRFMFVGSDGATLGRSPGSTCVFNDSSVSRQHARMDLVDGGFVLRDLGSANGSWVDGHRVTDAASLPATCRIQLGLRTVLQFAALDELGSRAVRKVSRALFLDPLTGTGNRYQLELRLRQELSYARRHLQPLGVMLLDIDHFKRINDEHGHQVGDQVLGILGRILLATVRAEDTVFRYGGEEFCVLIRGVPDEGLTAMAERIRGTIADASFDTDVGRVHVTASIGVAGIVHSEEESNQSIILRADRAMYRAKRAGRNTVRCHEPEL